MKEAVRLCLEDVEALGLERSSRKRSRPLLELQLFPFCEAQKFVHLEQILPIDLTEFRSTRSPCRGPRTPLKRCDRSTFGATLTLRRIEKLNLGAIKALEASTQERIVQSCLLI